MGNEQVRPARSGQAVGSFDLACGYGGSGRTSSSKTLLTPTPNTTRPHCLECFDGRSESQSSRNQSDGRISKNSNEKTNYARNFLCCADDNRFFVDDKGPELLCQNPTSKSSKLDVLSKSNGKSFSISTWQISQALVDDKSKPLRQSAEFSRANRPAANGPSPLTSKSKTSQRSQPTEFPAFISTVGWNRDVPDVQGWTPDEEQAVQAHMAKHPEFFRSVIDRCKFFKRIQGQGEFRKHTFDQFEKLVAVRSIPPPHCRDSSHRRWSKSLGCSTWLRGMRSISGAPSLSTGHDGNVRNSKEALLCWHIGME